MRWYDYVACFWFADLISANIVVGNFFFLTIAIVLYMFYEQMRKEMAHG